MVQELRLHWKLDGGSLSMEILIITSSAAGVGTKDGCESMGCWSSVRNFLSVNNEEKKKAKYVNDIWLP